MGWFDNQIKSRRQSDQQLLDDSFIKVAGVIMGQRNAEKISDERIVTKNAIDEILKYYHYKTSERWHYLVVYYLEVVSFRFVNIEW